MKRFLVGFLLALCTVLPVAAHGTFITYLSNGAQITVEALFDDGQPMAEAQVLVYAPTDPENVYVRGTADEAGRFTFEIDTRIAGTWDVNVRLASHGEWLRVPVTEQGEIQPMQPATRSIPASLIAVVVLAALGGIAYYFSRESNL